jgi:hypothetical protein
MTTISDWSVNVDFDVLPASETRLFLGSEIEQANVDSVTTRMIHAIFVLIFIICSMLPRGRVLFIEVAMLDVQIRIHLRRFPSCSRGNFPYEIPIRLLENVTRKIIGQAIEKVKPCSPPGTFPPTPTS